MASQASASLLVGFLNRIEQLGNRLPHPTTLFVLLCPLVLIISWIAATAGLEAVHPIDHSVITAQNLISVEGLHKILQNTVTNFTHFAPLGSVLVAMLGIGIAEKAGFIGAALRLLVASAPKQWITFVVVIAGVLSSLAADAGYVVLIPIAALLFHAAGKHPVAGITAAFAGVSGGFSANLIIGPVDVILGGLSTEAAHLVDTSYQVEATANLYFIIASTFLIGLLGTLVTEKIVLPYLGEYTADESTTIDASQHEIQITDAEKSGLIKAGLGMLIFIGILLLGLIPEDGALRNPETGKLSGSPFISGIVVILTAVIALGGIIYGKVTGNFTNDRSVIQSMEETMSTMAGYLVLMFFAAQFVNYFSWTNLGVIMAVNASQALSQLEIGAITLVCVFIATAALINLFIGSASAKWAILAPVFVPMFYLLGVSPELTQAAYRIGDSSTNIITPLMPYFGLVVAFIEKYDKDVGIGTVIALMLPYSLVFLVGWTIMISLWLAGGVPLGPDTQLFIDLNQ